MTEPRWIIGVEEPVLVTGAGGFLGRYVVRELLRRGFRRIRIVARHPEKIAPEAFGERADSVEVRTGDLRNPAHCREAAEDARVIYHCAADPGARSFAAAFQNTVIPTWNLADAALSAGVVRRFVNVGSFAAYDVRGLRRGAVLDETCPLVTDHLRAYNAYAFAKAEQDLLVIRLGKERQLPYVILRPGTIYGPGARERITSRVGIDTFGIFLHLGGGNELPLTYVENCGEAVVLAGLTANVEGEVFNIVDDFRPSSRWFLRWYRRHIRRFAYISIPRPLVQRLCALWEDQAWRRQFQLPPVYNRARAALLWGGHRYTNQKAKNLLGWQPRVGPEVALRQYAEYWRAQMK